MASIQKRVCNVDISMTSSRWRLPWVLALMLFAVSPFTLVMGCQSCLFSPFHHRLHEHHHRHSSLAVASAGSALQRHSNKLGTPSLLFANNDGFFLVALRSLSQTVKRQPAVKPLLIIGAGFILSKAVFQSSGMFLATDELLDKDEEDDNKLSDEEKSSDTEKSVTSAMVGTIGIYKNFISPLLPPSCRFLPTCSQYGVQAIEDFGPTKGVVLTAWRLLRCSPFGGKGYDPPKWPPVPYDYGSY